jgi:geranylgeranyl pyrophosphate synthase
VLNLTENQVDLQGFLSIHKQIIENFLARLMPSYEAKHNLVAALKYSVLNNGKRLRPALVYATGKVLNTPIEKLHAAAASVELVHCYSLVHDDLPAMDDDDLRRGLPTCHRAFDEATAILAGDALQSLAFQILADSELNQVTAQQQIAMVAALAKAIGAAGMVRGQAEDMAAEQKLLGLEELKLMHQRKTGALFGACIELALIASGQQDNQEIHKSLHAYGQNIGLAFQLQDDILDVVSTNEVLGKPVGSDQVADKSTFVKLLGVDGAVQLADTVRQQALSALDNLGAEAQLLRELADHLANRVN